MGLVHYNITIDSNVSVGECFARMTAVSNWWTKSFTGRALEVGDAFTVRFNDTFVDFEVMEALANKKNNLGSRQ